MFTSMVNFPFIISTDTTSFSKKCNFFEINILKNEICLTINKKKPDEK